MASKSLWIVHRTYTQKKRSTWQCYGLKKETFLHFLLIEPLQFLLSGGQGTALLEGKNRLRKHSLYTIAGYYWMVNQASVKQDCNWNNTILYGHIIYNFVVNTRLFPGFTLPGHLTMVVVFQNIYFMYPWSIQNYDNNNNYVSIYCELTEYSHPTKGGMPWSLSLSNFLLTVRWLYIRCKLLLTIQHPCLIQIFIRVWGKGNSPSLHNKRIFITTESMQFQLANRQVIFRYSTVPKYHFRRIYKPP